MEYMSHWLESICYPDLPNGECLAEVKAGDDLGFGKIKEIEGFIDKELMSAEYDGHYYYFSPDTTPEEIDGWCREKWETRLVRYTVADGIEFDFADEQIL